MSPATRDADVTPARRELEPVSPRFRVPGVLLDAPLRNLLGALGLLAVGLIITVLASLSIKAGVESAAQREFDFACKEIRLDIDARLAAGAQILRSGVALFDATETVSRGEWRAFIRRLQIEQHLPGIQGIGFAQLIPRVQLDQHVQTIRGEGFPDYQVWPAGERETYAPIVYLDPFEGRNLRAFGYDMLSEPVRRAAMERARDENTTALSGKVILVQETGQDVQAGILMYVPVYRHGLPIESNAQRRAAIQGWVYSPYRMTDLMHGTLKHWDVKRKGRQISLQIYDGDVLSADTLLYDSQGAADQAQASTARGTRLTPVDFAARRWTLRFVPPDGLAALVDYSSTWLALFGGTMGTFVLSGFMLWRQQRVRYYRNKAEAGEALMSSEERFRVAAENLTDIVYDWAIKEEKIDWHGDIDSLTGYPPGEFPRTISAWAATLHPEDKDRVMAALEAHLKDEATYNVEYRVRKRNGESRWWSARGTALRDERGEPYKMIGSITDITDRKRAEELLRESENKFRSYVENAPDGVFIADDKGRYIEVNKAACQMTGYSKQELESLSIRDLLAEESMETGPAHFRALRETGAVTSDLVLKRKDGSTVYVALAAVKLSGMRVLGFTRDITKRRQAQANLEAAQRQLVDISREAGMAEVATNVLHNVGNVLNSVNVSAAVLSESIGKSKATNLVKVAALLQGHADQLAEFLTIDPRGRQLPGYVIDLSQHLAGERESLLEELASLTTNVEHIKEIVAMQQNYARVTGVVETADPRELVEDAIRLNGDALIRHDVQIVREYADTPLLQVEKHRVVQILVNLIRNAKYALDEGDPLQRRLTLRVSYDGGSFVKIEVADNGIGISPENMPRIFEHGFTTRREGHGFGLHSAVLAAQQMGGSLRTHSDGLGQGAKFTLELPRGPDAASEERHDR